MVILDRNCLLTGHYLEPISSWGICFRILYLASTSHVCVVCKISYQVKTELFLFPMSNTGLGNEGIFIQTSLNTVFTRE